MWNNQKQQKSCFTLCQTYKPTIKQLHAMISYIHIRNDRMLTILTITNTLTVYEPVLSITLDMTSFHKFPFDNID